MKCKYCLQTNVVKNGRFSYDQYYKCKDCNRYFRHALLDDADPKEIQGILELHYRLSFKVSLSNSLFSE